MVRKLIVIMLLFISAFAEAHAGGQTATYTELQQMQDQEFDKLRSEYDVRMRRECPRTPEGKIDTNSRQFKKLADEYGKKKQQIQKKPSEPDKKQIENELQNLLRGGGAAVNGELNAARAEAEARAEAAKAAKAEAQAKSANAQAEAKAEAAKTDYAKAKAEAAKADSAAAKAEAAKTDSAKAQADSAAAKRAATRADSAAAEAAKAEADAKAEASRAEAAKAEADAKAKAAKAKAGQADSAKAEAEAKAEVAKAEAEAKAAAKAEADAKAAAKAKTAKAEAAKAEAEAKAAAKAEADLKAAKTEADAKAAKTEAEARAAAKAEADAKAAQAAADAKTAKAEASRAEVAKAEADAKAKAAKAAAEAEAKAAAQAEADAKAAQAEADAKAAQAEADAKAAAQAEADAKTAKAEADAKAAAKAEAAQAEATKAKAEADAAQARTKADADAKAAQAKAETAKVEAAKAETAKSTADANVDTAKTKAETAKTKAETARANTADAQIESAKAKAAADAPKPKTNAPDVDIAKTKVNAPDVPKINVDVPSVKTKMKAGAGKALKAGGDALQAVDVFSQAQAIKEDMTEGKVKDAAAKLAIAVADEVTGGAVSSGKMMVERRGDKSGMQDKIRQANESYQQRYEGEAYVKLVKEGNLSKEEAKAVLEAQRNGDKGALDRKMKELGVKPPELKVEEEIGPDDTWEQRSLALQEGVKNNVKQAGKFLKEAGEDTTEIATGLTEKGVPTAVVEQTVDNTKGWLQNWRENRKTDATMGEGKEGMEEYLVSRGATSEAAKKAADEMYNKGNSSAVRKLDDMLEYRAAVKEARSRGEEPPTDEEWAETGNSRLARDARAKLKEQEAKAAAARKNAEDKDEEEESLLAKLFGRKKDKDTKETESSMDLAEKDRKVKEASTSGDAAAEEAAQIVAKAAEEANDIKAEAERQVTQDYRENSMGKTIGDAIESSITAGGAAFGSTVGAGLAQEAGKKIFEKSDRKEAERLAKEEADKKAKEEEARREKVKDKKPGGSSGDGQAVAQSGGQPPPAVAGAGNAVGEAGNAAGGSSGQASPEVPVKPNESKPQSIGESLMKPPVNTAGSGVKPSGGQTNSAPTIATKPSKPSSRSGGECVRCAAPKNIAKEPLCLACTTRVMSSYSSYLTTNGREGGQDSQYFYGLSAGTKSRIESVVNREKEASANRKPYEGGAVDTTFP